MQERLQRKAANVFIASCSCGRSAMALSLEEHYRERDSRNGHQRTSANFFTRESAIDVKDVTKRARDYHSHEQYRDDVPKAETERVHNANPPAQKLKTTSAEFF
jgi:hypothetical protein